MGLVIRTGGWTMMIVIILCLLSGMMSGYVRGDDDDVADMTSTLLHADQRYTELYGGEDVPQGAASLAFVFDITGSMYDDLVQVIEGAAKILATTLARREKPLFNYVLVPFHDPKIGPVTVTTDPDEFQFQLRELYVQGGGDCPEMSVGAVKKALEDSLPNSFIYVFTDARAKDYHLTEQVLTLIQQKQSQVVFVMTGDCGNSSHPGYIAYEHIASTSSGQIFLLRKSQVNQVLNFVRVAVQSRKVNLFSVDRTGLEPDEMREYELPIDSRLQEFTVSISGIRPRIIVKNPRGERVTRRDGLNELLNIRQARIINIKDPEPGLWTMKIWAEGPHTIRVQGLSTLDFVHGFSRTPTLDLAHTKPRPVLGIPNYLLLNATDLQHPGRLIKVELMTLGGEKLVEIPVQHDINQPYLYNVSSFVPPEVFFFMKVVGLDNEGHTFIRTTHTAINAIRPGVPQVKMPAVYRGHYQHEANLVCSVDSMVPYSVQWYKDGLPLGNSLFFRDPKNVTWTVPSASSFTEGQYVCNATNAVGSNTVTTFLDVRDPPPTLGKPANVSVLPGGEVLMSCVAYSDVEYNITWWRYLNEQPDMNLWSRALIYPNGSLLLRNVDLADEGPYSCRASNEGGSSEESIFLTVKKPPIASIDPADQMFTVRSMVNISCHASGFPAPTFTFRRDGGEVRSRHITVNEVTGLMTILRARKDDDGVYECVASNSVGADSAFSTLRFSEAPSITVPEPTVLVSVGDTATLQCIADGIPAPTVKWLKDGVELVQLSFIQFSDDGRMSILGTQEMDVGEYECVATNEAGSSSATVLLDVGSSPIISKTPSSQGVEIHDNTTLECEAIGKPTPAVSWKHADGRLVNLSSSTYSVDTSGTLHIKRASKSAEGMYVCHVENDFGWREASAFITITGIVRPLIGYTNPLIETTEGRNVHLSCLVLLGNPRPTIKWFRMGEEVKENSNVRLRDDGSLDLTDITVEEEGEYMCLASNVGGNSSYIIDVDVQVPPRMEDEEGKALQVVEGNSILLPCEVSGDPPPEITWTKNGVRISEVDPHYFIRESGSLEIFTADQQDSATYSCTAMNVAGVKEKRMTLFVHVPPRIGRDEEDVTVIVSNPVQLPCEAQGIPPPVISWYHDGVLLTPELNPGMVFLPNGALRLSRAAMEDRGSYQCVATSIAGNATKIITLKIQAPPRIVSEHSSEIYAKKGEEVVVPCEVMGEPKPTVEWRHDLEEIDFFFSDHRFLKMETGSLFIPSVEITDSGRYLCIVENSAGVITQEVNLIVHEPPTLEKGTPTNVSIIENNRVVLPCHATGSPLPYITWYKDGSMLTGNELGVRLIPGGGLQLDNAEAKDAGRYTCRATNVAGNLTHYVDLTVFIPPRFSGTPGRPQTLLTKTDVNINETFRLTCDVSAVPPPQVTWYKNGIELTESDLDERRVIKEDGEILYVSRAVVEDTAHYECVASNLAGSTNRGFDVSVHVPPTIDVSLSSDNNLSTISEQPTVIDCPAEGIPAPVITWYKDDEVIDSDSVRGVRVLSNGQRLEIARTELSDAGNYRCVARNPAGEVDKDYNLDVWVPAKIDGSDSVANPEVIYNNTITLFCPAVGVPLPDVAWYRDNVIITANSSDLLLLENNWKLQIIGTEVEHSGRYSCRAKNIAGESDKYYDLIVLVPPRIDTWAVEMFPSVVENQSIALTCAVSGIPQPDILWLRNGEILDTIKHTNVEMLGGGRQLRINTAQVPDSGEYTCLVVNKAGADELLFTLDVHVPPTIEKLNLDLSLSVLEGQSQNLNCPAAGVPTPEITWYKDNEVIDFKNDQRVSISREGQRLSIRDATTDDTGRYLCRAANPAGTDQVGFNLQVLVPPNVDDEKSSEVDPSVLVGENTVLSCYVTGIPEPSVAWLVNGVPLENSSAASRARPSFNGRQLELRRVDVVDTSRYTCIATNEAGVADRDFDLSVLVPPTIDTENVNINPIVIVGKVGLLNCPAMGIPFPNVTWYKGDELLQMDPRFRKLQNGRQFEISLAAISDTSEYTCVATNIAGTAKQTFNLTVLVPPSIDEANIVDNPRVVINRTVLLECPVDGVPPPEVTWHKNGEPLVLEKGMVLLNNKQNLEIDRAQIHHTARFTCVASNSAGQLQRTFDLEVLSPPVMPGEGTTENIEEVENSTSYIHCQASGVPPPSIIWLKDGKPLLEFPIRNIRELHNSRQLEIRNLKASDAGIYECRATNVAGQKKKQFNLQINVPPRIDNEHQRTNLAVALNHIIELKCNTTGSPPPEVTWYKNGQLLNIANDEMLDFIEGVNSLVILAAEANDAGVYTCDASNRAGRSQKQYRLKVLEPPNISNSTEVEERHAVIGQTITLFCPATGVPEPSITWYRQGEPFSFSSHPNLRPSEAGNRLQVVNTQLIDAGDYRCEASNTAGNTSKSFILTVIVPPTIEEGPSEVTATVNTRTLLMCEANGLPVPTMTWTKDGVVVPKSSRRYRVHRSGSLEFSMVTVADSGRYVCEAENEAGSVSRAITLRVHVPPTMTERGPITKQVVLGNTVDLPCEASGVPPPRITWQKGTRVLSSSSGYNINRNGSMRIHRSELRDSGIYICVAQNNAGTALSQIRLQVQVPPAIEQQVNRFEVTQERDVTLPCRASGYPEPKISWLKDGLPINNVDINYRLSKSGWLSIPLVRVKDSGTYTCIASNTAGNSSYDLQLIVQVPPMIEEGVEIVTATQSDQAILPCLSSGFPPPVITWIQDGRHLIQSGGKYQIQGNGALVINDVQSMDHGHYVCTAKNTAGRASQEVMLRVTVPPTFTLQPETKEVNAGSRIELLCAAQGVPTPTIKWRVNNTHIPSPTSYNGRSRLVIRNADKFDDGTYMCVAENSAGERRTVAAIRVKVPPRVLLPKDNLAVTLAERTLLHCPVDSGVDPPPVIIWTKNNRPIRLDHRVQQMANGSLIIFDTANEDAGQYKCVATNDAGSSEGVAQLTVRSPPEMTIEPQNTIAEQGSIVMMHCKAEGEPEPEVTWHRGRQIIRNDDKYTILPNSSLRILGAQMSDSGLFYCMVTNNLGSVRVGANLTVQVHGTWSFWSSWSECSSSCAAGSRFRTRSCDNPEPANGGRPCSGQGREKRACYLTECPVNGRWSNWSDWEPCSTSCGQGQRSRLRQCNNPAPLYGGANCEGSPAETEICNIKPCPVHGSWSNWGQWDTCSATCGRGMQRRLRQCDNPRPQNDGRECMGSDTDRRNCQSQDCMIHGGWGAWTEWTGCSLSCGGGRRTRRRYCDNPMPALGGATCPGSDHQIDYCNQDLCPVHGNWAEWSPWGDCTQTCGGGQRRRFRTCTDPQPKNSGRPCLGSAQDTDSCNLESCPLQGAWGPWQVWSPCSHTCGGGMQQRIRGCQGAGCVGDNSQSRRCSIHQCESESPRQAVGYLLGEINNMEFGISLIHVNMTPTAFGTRVEGEMTDVPASLAPHLRNLVSFLTPIYWSTAAEVGEAINGYTLTDGDFHKEAQVEFATGEVLKMTHIARGVDEEGVMQIDILVEGEVPELDADADIRLLPYTEDYVQTGPGQLYASSSRAFRVNDHILPYAWNHTIDYDSERGSIPFLVQTLSAEQIYAEFDVSNEILKYQLVASITKGNPSDQCPDGFLLNPDGPYCTDDDECTRSSPCQHFCLNGPGSFTCKCRLGYKLDANSRSCSDVDECATGIARCHSNQQCVNTVGSFKCSATCGDGFRLSASGNSCDDINECQEQPGLCAHECSNEMGGYTCSCRRGYLSRGSRCIDVDECAQRGLNKCSHVCQNVPGGYRCACPTGLQLVNQFTCRDFDECNTVSNPCGPDEECRNTRGGYTCVSACPSGYLPIGNDSCIDIDECRTNTHRCGYNQVCINTAGGYTCTCPRGFRSDGPERACIDIDECARRPSPCTYRCHNQQGTYTCTCPPGQLLLADKKSCAGLEFPEQPQINDDRVTCPAGFTVSQGNCIDVNECELGRHCQHECQNTQGSFRCVCPDGYTLSTNGRTCQDINECIELNIKCGAEQMCSNTRGSYKCLDTSCPENYNRDPDTGYCLLPCSAPGVECPPGILRKEILTFRHLALPSGMPAYQDLIRLKALDQYGMYLPRTTFTIVENDPEIPFAIRLEQGIGIVYSVTPLQEQKMYTIKVTAKSFDHRQSREHIQYQTTFLIYISVSMYPY